ncbi:MAG: FAD:protein FMN transferase [Candidatus Obscuribacterales bacterium]|nr:FAD:protein FMN transferase [Steroidobacteraceae bacterium]
MCMLLATSAHAAWFSRVNDGIMGTRIVVELWSEDSVSATQSMDAVISEMQRIDRAMSTYKSDSDVSRVNLMAAKAPVKISDELFGLLKTSIEYSELTDGAFDITYASVGFMYDFHTRKKPSAAQIKAALPAVNYKHIALDEERRTVYFTHPNVRIDLGGIGKGHAVDCGIAILQQRGVVHALLTAGGDSRIIGDRFGKPWIIGIRHPDDKGRVIAKIPLEDTAISTSGDYERYFDENGQRYHHIIDPRSGRSASKVRSATILAPTATRTDGLSKMAFVLGAEAALKLYNRLPDVDAIIVTPDGKEHYTRGIEPLQLTKKKGAQ